jgi:hypothetical protein
MAIHVDFSILEALKLKLSELTWINTIAIDGIRRQASEVHEHETPFVQVQALIQTYQEVRQRVDVSMSIDIVLVLKPSADGNVSQKELMDRREEIEQKIGESPKLGIARVKGLYPLGNQMDLHSFSPWYVSVSFFRADYTKPYTGDC